MSSYASMVNDWYVSGYTSLDGRVNAGRVIVGCAPAFLWSPSLTIYVERMSYLTGHQQLNSINV